MAYAAELVPTISDTVWGVDEAMRLGYNWQFGPFELIDQLGADWFAERLAAEGRPVPELLRLARGRPFYRVQDGRLEQLGLDGGYLPVERPDGVLVLADVKRARAPLLRNGSAALWDIGDGVACFEFTSKMNALDADTLELLAGSIALVAERHRAMVIYNEGSNFSVGANLGLALFALNVGLWGQIEELVAKGQQVYRALKYAPVPDRRGAVRPGARRRLRDPAALRRRSRPMPRPISGWSRPASASCRPGAAARRCCCGRWPIVAAPAGRCRRSARRSS